MSRLSYHLKQNHSKYAVTRRVKSSQASTWLVKPLNRVELNRSHVCLSQSRVILSIAKAASNRLKKILSRIQDWCVLTLQQTRSRLLVVVLQYSGSIFSPGCFYISKTWFLEVLGAFWLTGLPTLKKGTFLLTSFKYLNRTCLWTYVGLWLPVMSDLSYVEMFSCQQCVITKVSLFLLTNCHIVQ